MRTVLSLVSLLALNPSGTYASDSGVRAYIDAFDRAAQSRIEGVGDFTVNRPQVTLGDSRSPQAEDVTLPGLEKPDEIAHVRIWIFIKKGDFDKIWQSTRDYRSHVDLYKPIVRSSDLCSQPEPDVFVFRYWTGEYISTITQSQAKHVRVSPDRYSIISRLTGIGGVDGADPAKLCNAPLKGVWYLADIHTAWRLQRMETGVFVEAEYAATIPKWGTRLLVKRTLSKLVKDTFERMRSNFEQE